MKTAFTRAFEIWEDELRADPSRFLTDEQAAAMASKELGEGRAEVLIAILDKLAKGAAWNSITQESQP